MRRRRTITAAAIMLMLFGLSAFSAITPVNSPPRPVDFVRYSGLIGLTIVLAIRSTTSFSFGRRNPELDDELT
ncbi:MAG TPA: hypothetical protein VG942_17635, partial [Hyphomonadaceae bacterium]|nr:hypothetical protein [Hyphomonadaceae bacterium]